MLRFHVKYPWHKTFNFSHCVFVSNFGTVKKLHYLSTCHMELEFKGPHSNKISLERRSRKKKKNWDQFAWDMASWRSQRNNNETFPRKTNGPTQLLQKFTTAQHHFFREIISTSLNETKARFFWKKSMKKKLFREKIV